MQRSSRPIAGESSDPAPLLARYRSVRAKTEALCAPLGAEDMALQSMPEASPVKWHLAHTTWFFELFVLAPARAGYAPFDPSFASLFNSYYRALGEPFPRGKRGLLSRPGVEEVMRYRRHVDGAITDVLCQDDGPLAAVVELGLHHEQQHQELILTDLKHAFAQSPLRPAYRSAATGSEVAREVVAPAAGAATPDQPGWLTAPGGIASIGHAGAGFAFDNEGPRHRRWLEPFAVATRLVTNEEWLAFIDDGGYRRPELWLSDGFDVAEREGWDAPLYWERDASGWSLFTLEGMRPLDPAEPVCHVSFYEADAFARWVGARLPGEDEWEVVARSAPVEGNLLESGLLHPAPALTTSPSGPRQLFGDVWEWTRSPYTAYPGYAPPAGALGEYNGKFMSGQLVLRGGSCATPQSHLRASYRNFFPPAARWQFSGVRLARDAR